MSRELQLNRPLVFIDVETTGKFESVDRVIELGVVKIQPNDSTRTRWRSLFNPGIPVPAEATAVHGITNEQVVGAPKFEAFAEGIARSFANCDVGGYNVDFDIKMLNREFARLNIYHVFDDALIVDAMRIFHKSEPRDLSAAVAKYLLRSHENAHTASADAEAAADVLEAQLIAYPSLPTDMVGLAAYCAPEVPSNAIDAEGKIVMRDGKPVLSFGKWAGVPLTGVEHNYLDWMLRKGDFSDEVKKFIAQYVK